MKIIYIKISLVALVGNGIRNILGKVLDLFDFVDIVHYRSMMRADDHTHPIVMLVVYML